MSDIPMIPYVTPYLPLDLSGGSFLGVLSAIKGGTGLSGYTVGDLLVANSPTTLTRLTAVAVHQVLASSGVGVMPAYTATPTVASITLTALAAVMTPAESWIGPSATTGVYFKGGLVSIGGLGDSILSINNTSAINPLETHSANAQGIAVFTHSGTGFRAPRVLLNRSGGTQVSPTQALSGDFLGYLQFSGYNSGSASYPVTASIYAKAQSDFTVAGTFPTLVGFGTQAAINSGVPQIQFDDLVGALGIYATPTTGLKVAFGSGVVGWTGDNASDIGTATDFRPRTIYVGTSVVAGGLGAFVSPAESWIGPSSTAGLYFKSGKFGFGGISAFYPGMVKLATADASMIEFANSLATGTAVFGKQGSVPYGAIAAGNLSVYTDNSGLNLMCDHASGIINFATGGKIEVARIDAAGRFGIGQTTVTALIHVKAGTATAGTAPFKFTSGTNLTTAETGAMEYDGTNLFFTRTGTVRENVLVAIDNVTAPSTSIGVAIVNYYGASATNFLGDPNRWLSVNVLGATYKVPLYN